MRGRSIRAGDVAFRTVQWPFSQLIRRTMIMRAPLKLNAIEQEHLQELYDAASAARDELPYTPKFEDLWQGFQDRTFKNAEREQVYGAITKYVRTGSPAGPMDSTEKRISDEQAKQLKVLLVKTVRGGKL